MNYHLQLLRFTFFCTVLVFGRAIFAPNLAKATPFNYPQQVELARSQFVAHQAITTKSLKPKYLPDLEGYQYQYKLSDRQFDVKVHYIRQTDGNVQTYLDTYGLNNQKATIKPTDKQNQTGFYSLFQHENLAYLSACINSLGSSTTTQEQFFANRNAQDLRLDRVVPIVLGVADVRDTRCLWVTISTEIENQSIELVNQQLEAVWQDVYAWWMPRFPKS